MSCGQTTTWSDLLWRKYLLLSSKTTSCSMEENSIIHGLMFSCLLCIFHITFLSHESFLVKNDRSAVDIRNRPRIPVPDEVDKKQLKQKKISWSQFISTNDDAGNWEHKENVVIVADAQDPYSVAGSGSSGSSGPGGPRWKTNDSLFSSFSISFNHLRQFSQYSFCPSVTKPARLHKIQSQEANLKWCREFEMLQRIWKMQFCNLILNIRTYQTKARLIINAFMTSRMNQFCWTWRLRCWQGRRSSGIRSPRSASKDKPPKLPPRDNSIYGPNHIPKVQHLPSIMTHLNVGLRQQ